MCNILTTDLICNNKILTSHHDGASLIRYRIYKQIWSRHTHTHCVLNWNVLNCSFKTSTPTCDLEYCTSVLTAVGTLQMLLYYCHYCCRFGRNGISPKSDITLIVEAITNLNQYLLLFKVFFNITNHRISVSCNEHYSNFWQRQNISQ